MSIPVINDRDERRSEPDDTPGTRITVHTMPGASVARIIGDVDLAVAERLRTTLAAALTVHPWIVVDLGQVEAVDSVGLGVLLAARQTARGNGGDLLLAAAPPFFLSVLRAARLDGVFPTYDTLPQAITVAVAGREPA
ncbi:STAS domain-containing protein [Actinoplanes sp. G11-F43]|uniref:STAS domain-containing protein n=1 Tax=Actinoplanes sp. G11-F43 TaxID=3424130 RepID=UPI003D341F55